MTMLIRGGMIVTPDGAGVRCERGTVVVDGDRIARVEYGAPAASAPADRVIDATRRLVIPGLVDAHSHAYGVLTPGLVDQIPLDIRMPALAATLTGWSETDSHVATLVAAWRMLRGGTTTVLENVLQGNEGAEPAIRALVAAGMRAIVGPMIMDRPFHETLPGCLERLPEPWRTEALAAPVPDGKELVAASVDIARRWDGAGGGRIRTALSPSTPHRCTDGLLRLVADASAAYGFRVHTHLLETRPQALAARRLYGHWSSTSRRSDCSGPDSRARTRCGSRTATSTCSPPAAPASRTIRSAISISAAGSRASPRCSAGAWPWASGRTGRTAEAACRCSR